GVGDLGTDQSVAARARRLRSHPDPPEPAAGRLGRVHRVRPDVSGGGATVRLLYGHDVEVTHAVCEQVPHLALRIPHFERGQVLGPASAVGVLNDAGTLVAGV